VFFFFFELEPKDFSDIYSSDKLSQH